MIKLCAFADEADNSLIGQIEALKRNGISYIELRNLDGKNACDLTDEEAINARKLLNDNGIEVWSLGSKMGKSDIKASADEFYAYFERCCKICNLLGTDKMRAFSFFHAYDYQEEVITRIKKAVEIASKYGVKFYHENEKDIFGDIASRVKTVLDSVDGIYSIYDPANYAQVGETDWELLFSLAKRCDYFHIKDCIVETGQLVPAGEGDARIRDLIDLIDGDKVLTLEPHLAVFEGYATIDDTQMKNKYVFSSNNEAFDCAVNSLKNLLKEKGYIEKDGGFVK